MQEFKFSELKPLIKLAFPEAGSRRKVDVIVQNTYYVKDYWDGGSRYFCKFIELATGNVLDSHDLPKEALQKQGNAYELAISQVKIIPGYCVIEHTIFCGKDLGYRIYINNCLELNKANYDLIYI